MGRPRKIVLKLASLVSMADPFRDVGVSVGTGTPIFAVLSMLFDQHVETGR